jgi:hypothetical protein
MAAPANSGGFVQGLLQSLQPWMTGGSPSKLDTAFQQYGGTQGLLDAMLQDSPGSQGAAAFGRAMEGVQNDALNRAASRQQLAQGGMQAQIAGAKMPGLINYFRMLATMQAPNGPQTNGAAPQSGAAGGAPGPAAAGSAPAPPGAQGNGGAPGGSPQSSSQPPIPLANTLSGATPQQAPQPVSGAPAPAGAPRGGFWSDPLAVMRFGTIGSAYGLPGAQNFTNYGRTALQYDPKTATQMALAKDPLTVDQAEMASAAQAHDAQRYMSAYTKSLTDANRLHISSMSGNVTGFGLPAWVLQSMANYNPQSGKFTANGKQQLIPGAASTEAALEAARAGAERQAQLGAETAPAGSGASPIGTSPAAGAPPQRPARPSQNMVAPQGFQGAAAARQENFIPPILAAPAKIAQAPGNTSLGQLETVQKEQAQKASELTSQWNEQADSAQQLLTQADQIDSAARDFTPGKYAEVKGEVLAALQPTGFLSADQIKSLGSYQEGQKLSIQLQATVTKQLGSREAAQVFSVMGKSIPNLTLSPDGLGKISAYLKGIARYQQATNTFGQRLITQGNVAGVNALPANMQTHSNPVYYILSSAPPEVAKELIGNMAPSERAKVQSGWKQAISMGLAPAPGDYD